MKNISKLVLSTAVILLSAGVVNAACELSEDGKTSPFDGKSLSGVQVDKASLVNLNKEHPGLNAIEKSFKGELQTCTNCTGKFIVCK